MKSFTRKSPSFLLWRILGNLMLLVYLIVLKCKDINGSHLELKCGAFFPGKMNSYRNMVIPNQLGVLCLGNWENWLRQILCLERSLFYPLSRLHACEPWSIKGDPLFWKKLVDFCSFVFAINVKKMCVPIIFWCCPNGIRHNTRLSFSFTEIFILS